MIVGGVQKSSFDDDDYVKDGSGRKTSSLLTVDAKKTNNLSINLISCYHE